jgi:hypothetical protein
MKGTSMKSLLPVLALGVVALLGDTSSARAQAPATVRVTIEIAPQVPSFSQKRLVVMLAHDDSQAGDRGLKAVDRHVDANFSHQQGNRTTLTITLGAKAKLKNNVQYYINGNVFDGPSKLICRAEHRKQAGPFLVLTGGAPSQITLTLQPAP